MRTPEHPDGEPVDERAGFGGRSPLVDLSTPELLAHYGMILTILRERGITRTEDSPVGGYAEHLAARAFGLTLTTNSAIGYESRDEARIRNVTQTGGVYVVMAMRPIRALAVLMLVVAALNGCVAAPTPGAKGSVSLSGSRSLTTTPATPTSTASPSANAGSSPQVLSACQLTKPTHPFVPPVDYDAPARPPTYYDAEWYGTARLWTMLRHRGEV